jgi:hypothetical protein
MKCLAAVALIVVGVAFPVCAQRSGSHGGFSGHSSSGFHGGFSGHSAPASHGGFRASAPSRYAGTPRSSGSVARGSQRAGAGNYRGRPPYAGSRHYRRPYVSAYGTGIPYYGVPGWIGAYPYGYGDSTDSDDSQASANAALDGSDAQPPLEPNQPPDLPPWQPDSVLPHPSPAPGSEDAVTLIFKDGRPPEQIHNYLLTRTTLYVDDTYHQVIPTSQLDLVATAKVNHDAGVDFRLPVTPQ